MKKWAGKKKRAVVAGMAVVAVLCGGLCLAELVFGGSGRPLLFPAQHIGTEDVASDETAAKSWSLFERTEKTEEIEQEEKSRQVNAAADGNWGLSFQQEGSAPVGNATPEYLAKFNAYYIGPENEKEKCIYLTFDAGYENGVTEQLLDVLKEEKVPAAFFVVGNFIEENPEIVKRMEAEGHLVGNHTMHHPDMSSIAEKEAFQQELNQLEEAYKKATGKHMKKYYRPPQGKYSESNLKQASDMGYTTVFWSLAYVDWLQDQQPTREEALNLLNKRIHPQAIVLLHSTSKTNGKILKELIEGWKEQGYVFRSVEGLGTQKM